MKYLLKSLASLFLSLSLLFGCNHTMTVDEALMDWAKIHTESCPVMIDELTRFDSLVAIPGSILQYNYTLVNAIKTFVDIEEFETTMTPHITNEVKSNPGLKLLRDKNVTMQYQYWDMNGESITQIVVTPKEYY